MRIRAEQLQQHIQQGLSPVYLIFGDEQMLVEESSDLLRQDLRKASVEERQVWHVDNRFDWSELKRQEQTMSLFSSKRLIELRLPNGSPGKEGGEALRSFAANPPEDTTLLIISGKIDARSQKSKWFSELERIGVTVAIWPVDIAQLPRWISQRLQQHGLRATQDVPDLIAERVEGNLFAAAQEIDKLTLLCSNDDIIDEQMVLESVADNARFEAFGLIDSVYLGQVEKIPRIIQRLKTEGHDLMAIFAAVSWSLHRMVDMAIQLDQGVESRRVFDSQQPKIWDNKRAMTLTALMRHGKAEWQSFLNDMARIDQAAKGSLNECPWSLLERLSMHVAGAKLS